MWLASSPCFSGRTYLWLLHHSMKSLEISETILSTKRGRTYLRMLHQSMKSVEISEAINSSKEVEPAWWSYARRDQSLSTEAKRNSICPGIFFTQKITISLKCISRNLRVLFFY
ncbi:uncharacterized protein LOC111380651 [Olea europaea var. sylvestris]|uniref:uncharacterized protein LOC111380651 n=1 Tax=Olea europaea var. sylvestris TaxID=158386 RepID=UPI000C1CF1EC|nr:uncharacterized protein LOC111380651 [Olea europaea var. sylvestris]